MKSFLILIPALIFVCLLFSGQGYNDININKASTRLVVSGEYSRLPQNHYRKFSEDYRRVIIGDNVLSISPNFQVHSSLGNQSETPITRHPTNPLIMLASANTFRGGSSFSVGTYVTTDGGLNWYGSDTLNNGAFNFGDPGPAIDKDGRFYMSYINLTGNIAISYSTDNGIVWSPGVIVPGSTTSSDKNFTTTDDAPSSPFYGRIYTVYTEFASVYNNRIVFSYSTNSGVSWSNVSAVSPPPIGNYVHQGADIRIGPNGEVYVVWASQSGSAGNLTEDSLGFAKSTDGGISWVVSRDNASNMNGIRNFGTGFLNNIRSNGFPRIAVDRTTGQRRGWIYASTSEKNIAPATDVADVILHRSTDGGDTWTSRRVNQDTPGNGKYQYFGAVNVDDQGAVNVIYYDTRNTPTNDSAQIYVSRSYDGGDTWTDILVSDHKFKPKPIQGLAGGYQGDYIGITSGNGKLWPYWAEDITGIYQAWTAEVNINLSPLNAFNLNSPSSGSRVVTYSNYTVPVSFNWDTSTTLASYKWIFGNPISSGRRITIPILNNTLTLTSHKLDSILSSIGVSIGDSIVGEWSVWAFRNNLTNDSLQAFNGPRAITLKRGVPQLTSFNLNTPVSGTSIITSAFNFSNEIFKWRSSGPGVSYKWKFGSPTISNVIRLTYSSDITGIDSSFTIANYLLDAAMSTLGVNPGDSISGEWSVWAYNGFDSVKASQNNSITFRRQGKGDILVLYDSTSANGRISKDSVLTNLNRLAITYDTYNRKGVTATDAISFRGYKRVMLLGEGSSVMSNKIKDSIKTYLSSGTTQNKSKLIIISEDIGYQIDRPSSVYYDSAFARSMCGFTFVADRPGVGGRGIVGVTINSGLPDSTSGPSSDVIKKSTSVPSSQVYDLYKYRLFADSMNAVGRLSPAYNVSVMALDVESIRPVPDNPNPLAVKRILDGLIKFVDEIPTSSDPNSINSLPTAYSLSQNYPNPFNPTTKISYQLPVSGNVKLLVYDIQGREVVKLVNQKQDAGNYEIEFNANNFASGVYFYRIEINSENAEAKSFMQTRRMLLIK